MKTRMFLVTYRRVGRLKKHPTHRCIKNVLLEVNVESIVVTYENNQFGNVKKKSCCYQIMRYNRKAYSRFSDRSFSVKHIFTRCRKDGKYFHKLELI